MTTQNHPPARGDFRRVAEGLYQYDSSGAYYARFRHKGERIMERLGTKEIPCTSLPEARRLLRDLKNRLDRTNIEARKQSLLQLLNEFENGGRDAGGKEFPPILRGAPKTLAYKKRHLKRIRKDFPAPLHTRVADIKSGDIIRYLAHYNEASAEQYNHALTLLRDIFRYGEDRGMIADSPVTARIKYRKREDKNEKLTPTWEQFQAIVASIRGQRFSDTATESADLVQFMGEAGLGQAECAGIQWGHINFQTREIVLIRRKTRREFTIVIYPWLKPLLERMNQERGEQHEPQDYVFKVKDPKKSLAEACKRLKFPAYSPRSFRRMFIDRCRDIGWEAQAVAVTQGHNDGGQTILKHYAKKATVSRLHELVERMTPPTTATNVIPIGSDAA
jgi:integrase